MRIVLIFKPSSVNSLLAAGYLWNDYIRSSSSVSLVSVDQENPPDIIEFESCNRTVHLVPHSSHLARFPNILDDFQRFITETDAGEYSPRHTNIAHA